MSMDFFVGISNNLFTNFKQSEIVYTNNIQLVSEYTKYFNQDNNGNNDFMCLKDGIYSDNDCYGFNLYGFIPPKTTINLGKINIGTYSHMILNSKNNTNGIKYRIIDIINGGEINGTNMIQDFINIDNIGPNFSIILTNDNENRTQYYIEFENSDGIYNNIVSGNIIYLNNNYNITYGKNNYLSNNINTKLSIYNPLISYFDMEELTGNNVLDFSQNSNDLSCFNSGILIDCGTLQGGPNIDMGLYGKRISLNGSGNYLKIQDNTNLNFNSEFSLSFWLYPIDLNNSMDILSKIDYGTLSDGYIVSVQTGGKLNFNIYNGGLKVVDYQSINNLIPAQWNYIVLNYNSSGNSEMFINGILDNEFSFSAISNSITNTNDLHIGTGNLLNYSGYIDEMKLFDKTLKPNEILINYNNLFSD